MWNRLARLSKTLDMEFNGFLDEMDGFFTSRGYRDAAR